LQINMKKKRTGKDYIGVGGGILILNKKGEALLMKRGKHATNEVGYWTQPGGTVEFGEKAADGLKREIKEELDIEVNIWGYLPHVDHIIKKENQHWVAVIFLASVRSGMPKIMEPHKCAEIRWFDLKKLPKKLTKSTSEPIKNYLKGKYIKL
jgi:8-oxo-dGTP diphosphatase